MAQTQKCTKCGKRKGMKQFYKNSTAKSGYRSSCKQCDASAARYRRNNKQFNCSDRVGRQDMIRHN